MSIEDRHPGTQHVMQYFEFGHLAQNELQLMSSKCGELAEWMVENLPDSPELTEGLRKLLEAKDCFVRAKVSEIRA